MADGYYKGNVYIPPNWRGNALALEQMCEREENEQCNQPPLPSPPKCEGGGLWGLFSRLLSGDDGWGLVILLVLALLLLGDGGRDKKEKCSDDTLLYLGLLFLLLT